MTLLLLLAPVVAWSEDPDPAEGEKKKLAALGQKLAAQLRKYDPAGLVGLLDVDRLLARTIANIAAPPDFQRGFRAGIKRKNLPVALVAQYKNTKCVHTFLRVVTREGVPRLMMRVQSTVTGFNYEEYLLDTSKKPVRVIDIYTYSSGEPLSRSMRRNYVLALSMYGRGSKQQAQATMQAMNNFQQAIKLYRLGRPQQALALWAKLPERMRKDKNGQLLRLRITSQMGNETYRKALDEFSKLFPGDPAFRLMSIDVHILARQWDQLLATLDWLDRRVGGDPMLDGFRVDALLGKNDLAGARKVADRLNRVAPDEFFVLIADLQVTVAEKNYARAVKVLQRMADKTGLEPADLDSGNRWQALRDSAPYKKWRSEQK